jgi:hypothetical protein
MAMAADICASEGGYCSCDDGYMIFYGEGDKVAKNDWEFEDG